MKAAIVERAGAAPVYGDFREPRPGPSQCLVRMRAAALSHLTRMRASGTHYSAAATLPFVPGADGVGERDDGRLVHVLLPEAPFGTMAELCVVDTARCVVLPDGLDAVAAAALAIPAMSSWAALRERARLVEGETVLVNGATGASGRVAVQIARHLGAARVIGTGRNEAVLAELSALGMDDAIRLGDDRDALSAAFEQAFGRGVDIVLDYLWGPSAEGLIAAAAKAGPVGRPIRFVQIGSIGGATIPMPAAPLRSSPLQLMGSGLGSVPLPRLVDAIDGALRAAASEGFRVPARPVDLSEVGSQWSMDGTRTVFTM